MKQIVFLWEIDESHAVMLCWCDHCNSWHVHDVQADNGESLAGNPNLNQTEISSSPDFSCAYISAWEHGGKHDDPLIMEISDQWQPNQSYRLN